jgi:ribosomal protein L5
VGLSGPAGEHRPAARAGLPRRFAELIRRTGNYTLGIRDQLIFPEIEYDKIDKLRGLEITIVTSARTDEEARALLQLLGMPFIRKDA